MGARQGVAMAVKEALVKEPAAQQRVVEKSVIQTPAVSSPPRREPSNDEIAARAYEIFLHRGGSDGADLDDWLQAERELQEKY